MAALCCRVESHQLTDWLSGFSRTQRNTPTTTANANEAACKYALFKNGHVIAAKKEHSNTHQHIVPAATNYCYMADVRGFRRAPTHTNRGLRLGFVHKGK